MTASTIVMHKGLEAEVGLPYTASWQSIQADEQRYWPQEYELTLDEYYQIYGPYDNRSVLMRIRHNGETLGVARDILPKPDATRFDNNDVGFLTIHAALAKDDAHGTPVWGKLTFDPDGWRTIGTYGAGTCTDSVTHIVPKSHRGGLAVLGLQSLEFGLSNALFNARSHELDADRQERGASIVTCLVRAYRDQLERTYSATTPSGISIKGFHRLGPESVYGGRNESEWVTPVIVSVNEVVAADTLRRAARPHINMSLFKAACPEFENYIKDYVRGKTT